MSDGIPRKTVYFRHPETGEFFTDQRTLFENGPYVAPDGVECPVTTDRPDDHPINQPLKESKTKKASKVNGKVLGVNNKTREVWEVDRDYVRKCNPKYVRTRKGQRVKYDPKSMG